MWLLHTCREDYISFCDFRLLLWWGLNRLITMGNLPIPKTQVKTPSTAVRIAVYPWKVRMLEIFLKLWKVHFEIPLGFSWPLMTFPNSKEVQKVKTLVAYFQFYGFWTYVVDTWRMLVMSSLWKWGKPGKTLVCTWSCVFTRASCWASLASTSLGISMKFFSWIHFRLPMRTVYSLAWTWSSSPALPALSMLISRPSAVPPFWRINWNILGSTVLSKLNWNNLFLLVHKLGGPTPLASHTLVILKLNLNWIENSLVKVLGIK